MSERERAIQLKKRVQPPKKECFKQLTKSYFLIKAFNIDCCYIYMKIKLILDFDWSLQAFRVGWKHSTLHTTSMCIMTMNCRHSGVINVESNLSSCIQSYARVKLAMFWIFFYQTLLGEISGETSKVTRICEGRDLRH